MGLYPGGLKTGGLKSGILRYTKLNKRLLKKPDSWPIIVEFRNEKKKSYSNGQRELISRNTCDGQSSPITGIFFKKF